MYLGICHPSVRNCNGVDEPQTPLSPPSQKTCPTWGYRGKDRDAMIDPYNAYDLSLLRFGGARIVSSFCHGPLNWPYAVDPASKIVSLRALVR